VTYSLVSTPVLGYDLCRLPRGGDVADVLLGALRLGPADLAGVSSAHPGVTHQARWRLVQQSGPARPGARDPLGSAALDSALGISGESVALLRKLERSTLGDLESLIRLVRHDILDWTWSHDGSLSAQDPNATEAVDVIAEALAAAYSAEVLSPALARELSQPWESVELSREPIDLGPMTEVLTGVLEQLQTLNSEQLEAFREVVAQRSGRAQWSEAMHDASWAVYLTDRIRPAASAQLLAVKAFQRCGFTPRDGSYGVWNAISGVVQSLVVSDLLANEPAQLLLRPWTAVFGEP
jgi:hypothetical protein